MASRAYAIRQVHKRDGRTIPFEPQRIVNAIYKATLAAGHGDHAFAANQAENVIRTLEQRFAARIPGVEEIQDLVEEVLVRSGRADVAREYMKYRLQRAALREAKQFFGVTDELKLDVNALAVMRRRYLLRDDEGNVVETPAQCFRRVAKTIAAVDASYGASREAVLASAEEFYQAMAFREFIPNSPTLMNASTKLGVLSACFVYPVEDSLENIFDAVKWQALTQQQGGGTGFSFSRLRPKGDSVGTTKGVASGPVSFMQIFDKATDVIKQGGCISSRSRVRTDRGVVRAGELLECRTGGENQSHRLVYTNGRFERAFMVEDNGDAEVFAIKTRIGTEVRSTYNHEICVVDGNGNFSWKRAQEVRPGDWLVHVLGGHNGTDGGIPRLEKQYRTATRLRLPRRINPRLAELLGVYMADGCLSTGGRIVFSVALGDVELQRRICESMKLLFGLREVIQRKPDEQALNLQFYSYDLCRVFEREGWAKHGAKSAFVPEPVFRSSPQSARAFLRGLLEGDGNVHCDGYPRLYSVSETLVQDVQQLLFGLGIVSNYAAYESTNRFGKQPVFQLVIVQEQSRKRFAQEIGFVSPRKNKQLASRMRTKMSEPYDVIPNTHHLLRSLYPAVGRGSGKGRGPRGANRKLYRDLMHYLDVRPATKRNLTRKRLKELLAQHKELQNPLLQKLANDEYFYAPVTSVSTTREHTMDINVPTAEHFVANSILVHNRRRGANMGILRVDHPDILEFITIKQDPGKLTNFNISVAVTDAFMRAVERDQEYELINPRSKEVVKSLRAKDVFDLLVQKAWQTGDPGLVFIDEINRRQPTPHLGEIESTNPCSEIPLQPFDSCNLGSINVARFVDAVKRRTDWTRLKRAVWMGVHFLDNVIDANRYLLPQTEKITKDNRKIGLGVMGFADYLVRLDIPYDSPKALRAGEELMRFVEEEGHKASQELAKKRGNFPAFKGSLWEKKGYKRLRNATVTTIAPTGTIAIVAGCNSGIEPFFAVSFVRDVLEGTRLLEVNGEFERIAKERGFYSRELMHQIARTGSVQGLREVPEDVRALFKTALEIPVEQHVRMQAAFQRYNDNATSKTINLPMDATVEDVRKAYWLAYKTKCKGITVYRYGSKPEQVLYIGERVAKKELTPEQQHVRVESEYAGDCPAGVCPTA